jgi:hypothetical protein
MGTLVPTTHNHPATNFSDLQGILMEVAAKKCDSNVTIAVAANGGTAIASGGGVAMSNGNGARATARGPGAFASAPDAGAIAEAVAVATTEVEPKATSPGSECGSGGKAQEVRPSLMPMPAPVPEPHVCEVGTTKKLFDWLPKFLVEDVGVQLAMGSYYNVCVQDAKKQGYAVVETFTVRNKETTETTYDIVVKFLPNGNVIVTVPVNDLGLVGQLRSTASNDFFLAEFSGYSSFSGNSLELQLNLVPCL